LLRLAEQPDLPGHQGFLSWIGPLSAP